MHVVIYRFFLVFVSFPFFYFRWEFKTSKYDIAFGVYKKTSAKQKLKDMQEMLPITKVNSQMVAQDGYLDCTTKGTCKECLAYMF